MENSKFAFTRRNFILIAIGILLVIIGFLLMSGSATTQEVFQEDIFSVRRIRVAPMVSLAGFIVVGIGILVRPTNNQHNK
ncbi:MAG: DUF3098 domain-containing protein [Bacteroidaceae bacterium]